MGYSEYYGPHLVIDYFRAPNISGYPKWDPNFGNYPFKAKRLGFRVGTLHALLPGRLPKVPREGNTRNHHRWVPLKGLYRDYMGIMEKKMETTI